MVRRPWQWGRWTRGGTETRSSSYKTQSSNANVQVSQEPFGGPLSTSRQVRKGLIQYQVGGFMTVWLYVATKMWIWHECRLAVVLHLFQARSELGAKHLDMLWINLQWDNRLSKPNCPHNTLQVEKRNGTEILLHICSSHLSSMSVNTQVACQLRGWRSVSDRCLGIFYYSFQN